MEMNPVGWFDIYVQDMDRAKKFYESVFQVKLEKQNVPGPEMWCFPMFMDRMGASGALVKMKCSSSGGNSTIVYFSCADCAVEEARAVESGGSVHQTKMSIGEHGFISIVTDTEGNMFGLHSRK